MKKKREIVEFQIQMTPQSLANVVYYLEAAERKDQVVSALIDTMKQMNKHTHKDLDVPDNLTDWYDFIAFFSINAAAYSNFFANVAKLSDAQCKEI